MPGFVARALLAIALASTPWLAAGATPIATQQAAFKDYNFLTWFPDGKALLFSAAVDGTYHLYRLEVDDDSVSQVTDGPLSDYAVSVSPDGAKLAYTEQCAATSKDYCLYVSSSSGTDARLLASNAAEATWRPDGRAVVFFSRRAGHAHLFELSFADSKVTQLTSDAGNDFSPAFSPDGNRIAFESDRDGGGVDEIYVLDVQTGVEHRLTHNTINDVRPTWSPDGLSIYWSQNSDAWFNLFRMSADGTGVTMIEPRATQSAISPSGELAYLGYPSGRGKFQIFLFEAGTPRALTALP